MGFKVFGGVALFRDPPLPLPLDDVALKIRKTPKTRFWTEAKISKSERLHNGVMLKISPTKGHKESR